MRLLKICLKMSQLTVQMEEQGIIEHGEKQFVFRKMQVPSVGKMMQVVIYRRIRTTERGFLLLVLFMLGGCVVRDKCVCH